MLWYLFLFLSSVFLVSSGTEETCQQLNEYFPVPDVNDQLQSSTVRVVSPSKDASNSLDCLCRRSLCSTPQYALSGDNETRSSNITVILESGVHVINDGLFIESASHVSFIGTENAVIQCGENPDVGDCDLLNVHIARSSFVSFHGITFQGCGSKIASVHVQYSNNVVFHNCVFKSVKIVYDLIIVIAFQLCLLSNYM